MNLRFVDRDGKKILQFLEAKNVSLGIEHWADVPTHQEPKKVTVEDELAELIESERCGLYPARSQAKAAIAFMKARMPKGKSCCLSTDEYNQALADVRLSLFGEA